MAIKKLRDTIGLKFDKKMTGKQLQACGVYKDSDGYLVASTLKYGVMLTIPWTVVFIKDKPKNNGN